MIVNMYNEGKSWEDFIIEWDLPFKRVQIFVSILNQYSDQLAEVGLVLQQRGNLKSSQINWINLLSKFDTFDELNFFKPYWVPISFSDYSVIVDISDLNFPMFRIHYNILSNKWFRTFYTNRLEDFLMAILDKELDPKIYIQSCNNEFLQCINR